MQQTTLLILITIALVALIDYLPRLFLLGKKAVRVRPSRRKVPDYVIMPTVYGNISYLKNLDFLKQYADRVIICTSVHETIEFYEALNGVCEQYGFRYFSAPLPIVKGRPVKNAYTIYKGATQNLTSLGVSPDTICILIDADTYAVDNVNDLVRTFSKHKLDIASLRCEVANPTTAIQQLQAFEYSMAMDNRRMDPWLTSGACNMAKASVFRHIFSYHSNFFAGGDVEIGKLGRIMGYHIQHIRFTFYTEAPDNLKEWFNQRIIWFSGGVRMHVLNMGSYGWHHFFIFFYNSLLVYLLFPLRWVELVNFPLTMAALLALSWVYTAVFTYKRGWKPVYLLLPFYAFIQSMVVLPLAFGRYAKLAWAQRSLGILRHDTSLKSRPVRVLNTSLNITSAALVIYAAMLFTESRLEYWVQNGTVAPALAQALHL